MGPQKLANTECPTQMGTTSSSIFFFRKHICQKIRPVLKSLGKKLSDGTLKPGKIKLEVFLNSKSKKCVKFQKKICTIQRNENVLPGGVVVQDETWQGGGGAGAGGMVQFFFWNLTHFFDFEFKNTSNLIFPGFKVPSKSFFPKNFKTGLTF